MVSQAPISSLAPTRGEAIACFHPQNVMAKVKIKMKKTEMIVVRLVMLLSLIGGYLLLVASFYKIAELRKL